MVPLYNIQGYKEKEIKVWKALPMECELNNIEPGKILAIEDDGVIVKCGHGCIKLLEYDVDDDISFKEGEYL